MSRQQGVRTGDALNSWIVPIELNPPDLPCVRVSFASQACSANCCNVPFRRCAQGVTNVFLRADLGTCWEIDAWWGLRSAGQTDDWGTQVRVRKSERLLSARTS